MAQVKEESDSDAGYPSEDEDVPCQLQVPPSNASCQAIPAAAVTPKTEIPAHILQAMCKTEPVHEPKRMIGVRRVEQLSLPVRRNLFGGSSSDHTVPGACDISSCDDWAAVVHSSAPDDVGWTNVLGANVRVFSACTGMCSELMVAKVREMYTFLFEASNIYICIRATECDSIMLVIAYIPHYTQLSSPCIVYTDHARTISLI